MESRARDGVIPSDPASTDYPALFRMAVLRLAALYWEWRQAPQGVNDAFGGGLPIGTSSDDIDRMVSHLLRLEGFA
jgi:hypothetical protein